MKNYLVTSITPTMIDGIEDDSRCTMHREKLSLQELKNVELISTIPNEGLLGSLRNMGIEITTQSRYFSASPEDVIYLLSVKNYTSKELMEYKDAVDLPDDACISVQKIFWTSK